MYTVQEQYDFEVAKRDEVQNTILVLGEGKKPNDLSADDRRAIQRAIRVFKMRDGRIKRLLKWYPNEISLV